MKRVTYSIKADIIRQTHTKTILSFMHTSVLNQSLLGSRGQGRPEEGEGEKPAAAGHGQRCGARPFQPQLAYPLLAGS